VVYFVIGIGFGMYMGIADQFQFSSAHAHINLLGWVSFALVGVIYHLFPVAGGNKMASVHFWLQMIGVPLLTFSMVLFGLGKFEVGGPLSGIGGTLVAIGVLIFAVNVLKNIQLNGRS